MTPAEIRQVRIRADPTEMAALEAGGWWGPLHRDPFAFELLTARIEAKKERAAAAAAVALDLEREATHPWWRFVHEQERPIFIGTGLLPEDPPPPSSRPLPSLWSLLWGG